MNLRLEQLNELDEFRLHAYERSYLYKERMKKYHDQRIVRRNFQKDDMVLLFNSRLKLFPGARGIQQGDWFQMTVWTYCMVKVVSLELRCIRLWIEHCSLQNRHRSRLGLGKTRPRTRQRLYYSLRSRNLVCKGIGAAHAQVCYSIGTAYAKAFGLRISYTMLKAPPMVTKGIALGVAYTSKCFALGAAYTMHRQS
ncbi:hypothetical protein CQW23_16665 [Capsicum baccatum]|uniref:Uncharacterized protein n=1 Tax=Capsicum baccatum TaxID=33114 RepID=A0A2G2WBZ8_CAPBA|nr:hypothetical protein CQW23_16665 [Capsicum baccatum]